MMSHSSGKREKKGPSEILTSILLQNIKKIDGGPFGNIEKFWEKSLTVPKKRKGEPFNLVRFCMLG